VKVSAFRQKKTTSTVLSARVPTDTSERLHALASARGLSISEYLSRLIEESLDHDIVEGSGEMEGEERP